METQNSGVRQRIFIRNMMCSSCIRVVKEDLTKLGISVLDVKLGEATIVYDTEKISRSQIDEVLQDLGMGLISNKDEILVDQIKQTVIELVHYMNNVDSIVRKSEYLVEKMGKSYQTLSKLFSKVEPITLEKYIILQKIERVKELAMEDKISLSEIAWMMDYSSPHHLSNQFKIITGISLSDFKKDPAGHKKPINQLY
ncbi:MAG: helix-turn-helix domain-containing protein [Bacteroidota bacterium]|nr:AraC family transcriptional regulator [Odoribacter sp.]MDP3645137.1 helix-turn-helix domain-containing protein [Bacteroidota bacterium]